MESGQAISSIFALAVSKMYHSTLFNVLLPILLDDKITVAQLNAQLRGVNQIHVHHGVSIIHGV